MPDLFLIRHGQTEENVVGFVMGRSKHPLNTNGKSQSRRLSKFLKDVELNAIHVSPSMRALQTAQIIMKGRDAIPLVEEAGLDEVEFGEWVGKTIDDIRYDEGFDKYMYEPSSFEAPGGEKVADAQTRAVAVVRGILEKHDEGRIAVISHADVIKSIIVHFLEIPLDSWQSFKIDNASVTILRFKEGKRPRVITMNCHDDIERYCAK